MRKINLRKARPENVKRLAKYLRLRIDGMSINQIIGLVSWRISERRMWR